MPPSSRPPRSTRRAAPLAALVLAGLVLASPSLAEEKHATSDPSAVALSVHKSRLANGLEVILHEDHRTPIVSVNLWYHVGSKDEAAGRNGFAHLFEHVMFQGSKHVPEDTYFRDLERAGASTINGSTTTDRTNYFETVPKNRLELALWLESDRMGFLLDHVDQATFASQRDVVKNERRQNYENAPYGMVPQFLAAEMYPADHPYHLLTIGSPEDLDAATLEDVRTFFRTWYVPNNATLVIAGDIDAAEALVMAEKWFGPIPAGTLPDRSKWDRPTPVTLTGEKVIEVAAGVELPRVYMVWPTPATFRTGDGELDLLSRVLSSGKTSRLYKRLVYDMQIAASVSANQESAQLGSEFAITATAQRGHTAAELRAAIDDELRKLAAGTIAPEELARAKAGTVADLVFGLERDSSRADRINYYNQEAGDPAYLPKDVTRYETATAETVAGAARQYLPLDRRIVVVVTPDKSAPVSGTLRGVTRSPVAGGAR